VENRAGAGGTIGTDYVAKAAPDGYTLQLAALATNATAPAVYPKLPYDPTKGLCLYRAAHVHVERVGREREAPGEQPQGPHRLRTRQQGES
jgi:tripartite-type tricarboxylate transporter receptor subunit TctC